MGDSKTHNLAPPRAHSAASRSGCTGRILTPKRPNRSRNSRQVPPYNEVEAMTSSPLESRAKRAVLIAPMPLEKSSARSPPSSCASADSAARTVGFS